MPIIVSRDGFLGDVELDVQRLEALVSDLKLIADGRRPTTEQLRAAPLLDQWQPDVREAVCLSGYSQNHPTLQGPTVCTSEMWAFAPTLGWARTISRFYQLGRPRNVENAS